MQTDEEGYCSTCYMRLRGGRLLRYTLALTSGNIAYFVQMFLVGAVADAIEQDLSFTPFQYALLAGPAFTAVRTLSAVPLTAVSHGLPCAPVLGFCLAAAGVATVSAAWATRYSELLAARVVVAMAGSAAIPLATALLHDVAPRAHCAAALATLNTAPYFGLGGAIGIGGAVAADRGWRAAFRALGLAALPFASFNAVVLFEPVATAQTGAALDASTADMALQKPYAGERARASGFGDYGSVVAHWVAHPRYLALLAGCALRLSAGNVLSFEMVGFFSSTTTLSPAELSRW